MTQTQTDSPGTPQTSETSSDKRTALCAGCKGTVAPPPYSRKISLERALAVHADTCPAPKAVKRGKS